MASNIAIFPRGWWPGATARRGIQTDCPCEPRLKYYYLRGIVNMWLNIPISSRFLLRKNIYSTKYNNLNKKWYFSVWNMKTQIYALWNVIHLFSTVSCPQFTMNYTPSPQSNLSVMQIFPSDVLYTQYI